MSRSIWKGKFIYNFLLKKNFLKRRKKLIWTRNSAIPASLIGKPVFIYNGLKFFKSYITKEKVGFKFGEFSYTRAMAPKKDPKAKDKKPAKKSVKPVTKKK